VCEKDIAHIGLDGYFWFTEKVGLNSLSVGIGSYIARFPMS
jgi:hypothetical protein